MAQLIIVLLFAVGLLAPAQRVGERYRPQIPRTWDPAAMASLQVPLAIPSASPVHASAEYYYRIPEMKIYRSYPIYTPGREPVGYMERLKRVEPQVVFDASQLRTREDWLMAGGLVFDAPIQYDAGAVSSALVRDPEWYKQAGIPVTREGIMPFARYVIRNKGVVEVGSFSCAMCHTRVMPDGSVIKGAQGNYPLDRGIGYSSGSAIQTPKKNEVAASGRAITRFRFLFGAPWIKPDPLALYDRLSLAETISVRIAIPPGVLARHGTSLFSPVQIPDLIGVRERRYLDRTGLVRHRSIGDLMRYAALNQGGDDFSDYGGFVPVKQFSPDLPDPATLDNATLGTQGARYSDEQLYALAVWLYSLKPPPNPNRPNAQSRRGRKVFEREGCSGCHTPPLYTNNRLTPATGFAPPPEHQDRFDILPVSVGTDPELALRTRRGTGYYKVPSLKGVWYRGPFEHNGSVATLQDWFDPARLRDDYVSTGWRGHGMKTRPVKGHEFGLTLPPEDKEALICFLKTL
jgi:hypothetical protein